MNISQKPKEVRFRVPESLQIIVDEVAKYFPGLPEAALWQTAMSNFHMQLNRQKILEDIIKDLPNTQKRKFKTEEELDKYLVENGLM